jgi:hypothetical protein
MENVDIEEFETGSDNNRGGNEEGREGESGQLGVDSGQERKVGSTSGKSHMKWVFVMP